jgi:hypothetical protein
MLARHWFAVAALLVIGFGAGAAILPARAALFRPPVAVELPPKAASVTLVLDDPTWLGPTTGRSGPARSSRPGSFGSWATSWLGRSRPGR